MTETTPAPTKSGGHFRWTICALLFFSVAVNYIDRLAIGILKKPLSEQFGWTDADYGHIAAAFSFAYAFGYLLGGRLLDRVGVKRGLPVFVFIWSLAAMAHGLCSFIGATESFRISYPWVSLAEKGFVWVTLTMPMTAAGFMFARLALGLALGGNFPAAVKTVAEWYPVKERALATGLFNAGTNAGAILCPIVIPWILIHLGWEAAFYITGSIGFLWVAAWCWIYESPEKHPRLTRDELHYIQAGQLSAQATPVKVTLFSVLSHRAVWAFLLASILTGPVWGFYQFFLPDFLDKNFKLSLQAIGWWTAAFFGIATIGGVAGGWLAGWLMGRGWTVSKARKFSLLLCAVAVVPVIFAPHAHSVWLAILIIGIAGSAHQGWTANLFSVVSDNMPKEVISSVIGLGGFVAYFTGGFVNEFTGLILHKTGSYVIVFAYFSGMYILSLIGMQLLLPKIEMSKAEQISEQII